MAADAALDSLADLPRDGERLSIEANLGVAIDGQDFAVSTAGDRVIVHAPSVSACFAVLSGEGGQLPALAGVLADAGVTVELRTGDAVLAVVGAEAAPSGVTAALMSEAVEVRASGVLAGLLRAR